MKLTYSFETMAVLYTMFFRGLLNITPYAKEYELNRFETELNQELVREAVQVAHEIVQAKMLEGLYENMEQMNADLEFQIKIQINIRRNQ
jgi:hypothetical protein